MYIFDFPANTRVHVKYIVKCIPASGRESNELWYEKRGGQEAKTRISKRLSRNILFLRPHRSFE